MRFKTRLLTADWRVGGRSGGAVAVRVEEGAAVLGVELDAAAGAAGGATAGGGCIREQLRSIQVIRKKQRTNIA